MGFQKLFEYRLNFVWSTMGTIISTLILYLFWTSILDSSFPIGNYFLLISIIGTLTFSSFSPIADDIWEGDLATDLLKPYNYFLKMFLFEFPYKVVRLLFGIILFVFISRFTNFTISFLNGLFFVIAIVLVIGVKFFMASLIGGLAFWFKRVHGFNALILNFGGLFSGELIPLSFLPLSLDTLSRYLPFRYLAYFPVQLALGQTVVVQSILGLVILILWLTLLVILNRLIWTKGLAQFEATGR